MSVVTTDHANVYQSSIVIDGMNNARMTAGYLRRMLQAGVSVAMVPVSITDTFNGAIEKILALRELVKENSNLVTIVESVDDIRALKSSNRLGLILALEDSRQLDRDTRKVKLFYDLGIRRMQLMYTSLNDAGCGGGERIDTGLSRFGINLIKSMEECGMLIDLCHCSSGSLRDAVSVATKPAIWSHKNVRGVYNHPMNLSDEELDLVAKNGGVIGISAIPWCAGEQGKVTLRNVLDHVDYVAKRIGAQFVAIGLAIFENHPPEFYERFANLPPDKYGNVAGPWPLGISSVDEVPSVAEGLFRRGYSDEDVRAILGGNYLRLLEQVW